MRGPGWLWSTLFLLASASLAIAQPKVDARNHFEAAWDAEEEGRNSFLENWTDVSVRYKGWRVGLRYQVHEPPSPVSQQEQGHGIRQRFIEYQRGPVSVTAGNFYSILGRGLTLRTYESRGLRYDTNIDGLNARLKTNVADVELLAGKPRTLAGDRINYLFGGELKLKPVSLFHLGGTYLNTRFSFLDQNVPGQWGSLYGEFRSDLLTVYFEHARSMLDEPFSNGTASYLSSTLTVDALAVLVEWKRYSTFEINGGVILNQPPIATREHTFVLMNRPQHLIDALDEKGFQVEATYPVVEDGYLTLNHAQTRRLDDSRFYFETFGRFEWDRWSDWNFIFVGARQDDPGTRYQTGATSTSWQWSPKSSGKATVEFQSVEQALTGDIYHNQAFSLAYSRAEAWTVSLIAEHSSADFEPRSWWFGAQLDVSPVERIDATVFGGSRRAGKVCTGGVCVIRPEFQGIELVLIARL